MVGISFLYAYLIFNVALFLYGLYIFFRVSPDLVKKSEYLAIRIFIVFFELYVTFNTIWTMQEYDVIQLPRWLFIAVCFMSFVTVLYNSFCFFAFAMIHFDLKFNKSKKSIYLSFIPCFTAIVLLVISLFNGMIFSVSSDNNIINGPAYIALPLCSFVYFVLIVKVSIEKAIRLRSKFARRDALGLTLCVVFLIIWVLLDSLFDRITIIPIAIFSVIFFLFTSMQQSNIYTDALTKMNNRRKAEEYFAAELETISESAPVYLFMSDVNSFKQINDRYGHIRGDEALILTSSVIKKTVAKYGGFAARYGGDEFIWAWRPAKTGTTTPDDLIREIDRTFTELCRKEKSNFPLSMSVGYVLCTDPKRALDSYIKEADEMMYRNKMDFYARRRTSDKTE